MSTSQSDWGFGTDRAWEDFSTRLGMRLIALRAGQEFEVLVEGSQEDGPARGIRFERLRRSLRQRTLPQNDCSTVAEFTLAQTEDALQQAITVLRQDLGVIHPAFLIADLGAERTSGASLDDMHTPWHPRDREHLDQLLDQFFSASVGAPPERDEDGDIALEVGESIVYLRTSQDAPVISLSCLVVNGITDEEAALYEVNEINRRVDGVNFFVFDDRIHASAALVAMPLIFASLNHMLQQMCELVAGNDRQLARRTGGHTCVNHDSSAEVDLVEDIHPVMLSILQLDAERPGSVRPKTVAKLCAGDPDLVLELIRWSEEQEIAWREARDDALMDDDDDEAFACEHERAHVQRTAKVLRKALRRILEV